MLICCNEARKTVAIYVSGMNRAVNWVETCENIAVAQRFMFVRPFVVI